MFSTEIVGIIAGVFTTTAFIPQVYKTWKTKSAKDVSMPMFVIFATGTVLWTAYGMVLGKFAIILPNIIIFVLAVFQVLLKIHYDKSR